MTLTKLKPRDCVLDEATHKYFWNPGGQNIQMAISVTGVIAAGKPPVDWSKYPEAAPRGTHVHRCMQALAEGTDLPDPVSPEGIDCSEWFRVLQEAAPVGPLRRAGHGIHHDQAAVVTRRPAGSAGAQGQPHGFD